MTKTVKVNVGKDGKPSFDFGGFKGDDCYKENEKIWTELSSYGITPAQAIKVTAKIEALEKPQEEEQLEHN